MTYGETIRKLRIAADLSQTALADRIGLRNDELNRCESGARDMTEEQYIQARAAIIAMRNERDAAYEEALKAVQA